MNSALTAGQRAARLRKVRGLTQQQLADAVGISRVYLNTIEHDQAPNVRPLILDAIAAELGFASWQRMAASRTLEQVALADTPESELARLRREVRELKKALGLYEAPPDGTKDNSQTTEKAAAFALLDKVVTRNTQHSASLAQPQSGEGLVPLPEAAALHPAWGVVSG